MRLKLLVFVLIATGTCLLFAGDQHPVQIRLLYQKAEALYNDPEVTDAKDSAALSTYYQLIALLEESRERDSILWDCYYKTATYEQTLGNFDKAIPLLRKNISLARKLPNIPGALSFLPNLYTANSYYTLNRYDSARYFYGQAEEIALKYNVSEGLERLYNGFGILNFETGNYNQSKNNFEKAISIASSKPSPSSALLVNFKSNLASALRGLREFDQALDIYRDLLPLGINLDELYQNIAASYQGKQQFDSSLYYLRKVKHFTQSTYNSAGYAFIKLRQYDSASAYLFKAADAENNGSSKTKTIENGLRYYYLGELFRAKGDLPASLKGYQLAINQFIFSFTDTSIYSNPTDYTGCFGVTELFQILLAKARSFEDLYKSTGKLVDLQAALETLRSLYLLTDYAEKTYESDEARLFLNQQKYESHHFPINVCLELFQKTGDNKYLKEAFFFDERNKASVLSIGVSEKQLKKIANIPEALLAEETSCREMINSLVLRASGITELRALTEIRQQLRDQQLVLESIDKKMNQFPAYSRLKFSNNTINIDELQNDIIPGDGVIVSFHWGDSSLLTWIISKNKFEHIQTPVGDDLSQAINQLYTNLTKVDQYTDRSNRSAIALVYAKLIQPIEDKIQGFNQLMIIPDDEINFVPFDLILNEKDERVLDKFTISYNYSCSLLKNFGSIEKKNEGLAIGFAPFSERDANLDLPVLPASSNEIRTLNGKILTGKNATKESFIKQASDYPLIHLATHALANDANPIQSYIAFYPGNKDSIASNRLYSSEIYTLDLSNTKLVILSACETGSGQLMKGEGIMSLARSFSYAGCPNMITSQWKADDGSTAYITEKIHQYLSKGKGIAAALSMSKKDYLNDPGIDARAKTASYWTHLRFTGQFAPQNRQPLLWLWALVPLVLLFTFLIQRKIRLVTGTNRKGSS